MGGIFFGILATQDVPCQDLFQAEEQVSAERLLLERSEGSTEFPVSGAITANSSASLRLAHLSGLDESFSSALMVRPPTAANEEEDPCTARAIEPNSMSPTWNLQASTVQCGSLELDNLVSLQPLGGGMSQYAVGTTAKYGLTPRLEVRWVLPGRMSQKGGGVPDITGTTDQLVGLLYHFHEHTTWTPDLSVSYAFKFPTADPSKGFGSGFADHMFTLVASRDVGANHVDFNVASTLAGGGDGADDAGQYGLGFSHSFAHHWMATVEAFGGPQPFCHDRYGAGFVGGSWGIRPWLALNGGYIRSYTAGAPPNQYLMGFIYTTRPRLTPARTSLVGRVLGR